MGFGVEDVGRELGGRGSDGVGLGVVWKGG